MHENSKKNILIFIFIFPTLFSFLLTILGFPVFGRDDFNYINEVYSRNYTDITFDYASWALISFIHSTLVDPTISMRAIGLFLTLVTIFSIKKDKHLNETILYFIISIFPLYWSVYFNQVRLGMALWIFIFIATRGYPRTAVIGASFAHLSILPLLFPAAIVIVPLALEIVYTLDPASFAVVRFNAYRSAEFSQAPWYLGWELAVISCIFLTQKKYKMAISALIYTFSSRMLADLVLIDVGRRLIEIGFFIYSPLVNFLITRESPARLMILLYISLGLLSSFMSFTSGVLFFG